MLRRAVHALLHARLYWSQSRLHALQTTRSRRRATPGVRSRSSRRPSTRRTGYARTTCSPASSSTGRCYLLVAQLRADAGDSSRAIELCELAAELLSIVPNRFLIEAYGRLADLFQAEGRLDEALGVLKLAVQAQGVAGRRLV